MKVKLFGRGGSVGGVLAPAIVEAGHEVVEHLENCDAAIDFTAPDVVEDNVRRCIRHGVPVVVGTTGWDVTSIHGIARTRGVAVFHAPNFSLGAALMIRLAALVADSFPNAHITEMHAPHKRDQPSGTALATAKAMGTEPTISSIRLPGLIAHQEILFGGPGEYLTIRHDTTSRHAYIPGVLLALAHLPQLQPGVTIGLEHLPDRPSSG